MDQKFVCGQTSYYQEESQILLNFQHTQNYFEYLNRLES